MNILLPDEFKSYDKDGNLYKGTKDAPKDGFKNGSYYYNSSAINLTKYPLTMPEIEWTHVKNKNQMSEEFRRYYDIFTDTVGSSAEFTVSGISNGYGFYVHNDAIIHINKLTANMFDSTRDDKDSGYGNNHFFRCIDKLKLDITGDNFITCAEGYLAVSCNDLKLSGNGALTVTSYDETKCGIWATNNYGKYNENHYENTDVLDVSSQLAAEGYTVIRSARTDNADGTYTWTYTVKPKE